MSIEHKWKCVTDIHGNHLHDDLRSRDMMTGKEAYMRVNTMEGHRATKYAIEINERKLIRERSKSSNQRNEI